MAEIVKQKTKDPMFLELLRVGPSGDLLENHRPKAESPEPKR